MAEVADPFAPAHHGPAFVDVASSVALLRAALRSHTPADGREADSIERLHAELERLADPYDEHAGPVHVTGSAFVVGVRGVVLHRHRRLDRWLQPGGHVDPGEHPWDAAWRECVEETGLVGVRHPADRPCLVHVDVHPGPRGHTHLDLRYLLVAPGDPDPAPPPGESPDVAWFSWERAFAVAGDPALRRGLTSARRRWAVLRAVGG